MIHITIEIIDGETKKYKLCDLKLLNNDTMRMVVKED